MEMGDGGAANESEVLAGLSTVLVATIQEVKDRISHIEFIFCNQLFPRVKSRSKSPQTHPPEPWKKKESSYLLQISNLRLEKRRAEEEFDREKAEKAEIQEKLDNQIKIMSEEIRQEVLKRKQITNSWNNLEQKYKQLKSQYKFLLGKTGYLTASNSSSTSSPSSQSRKRKAKIGSVACRDFVTPVLAPEIAPDGPSVGRRALITPVLAPEIAPDGPSVACRSFVTPAVASEVASDAPSVACRALVTPVLAPEIAPDGPSVSRRALVTPALVPEAAPDSPSVACRAFVTPALAPEVTPDAPSVACRAFVTPALVQSEQGKRKKWVDTREREEDFLLPVGSPLVETDVKEIDTSVMKVKGEFKFIEPVRKKADRENLKGIECKQCKKFYDAVLPRDGSVAEPRCEHHQGVSRHRFRHPPPMTPEGFWNIGFDTEDAPH